jgi:hypothetical protein
LLFDTTEAQKLRVLQVFQQTVLTSTLDLVVSGRKKGVAFCMHFQRGVLYTVDIWICNILE